MNANAKVGFSLWVVVLVSEFANAQPQFTEMEVGLPPVSYSGAAWGEFDGDGYLDIAITGTTGMLITRIYRNNRDGTFTDIGANLPGAAQGEVAWGDYDNDGKLDLLLSGTGGRLIVYRNAGNGKF